MGINFRKHFRTDRRAEAEGVWVDIANGARLRIARDTNPIYRKKLQDVIRPYRGAIAANALDDETSQKLMAKAAAGTVLVGWEGYVDDAGHDVPYSFDEAEALLSADPDFYAMVMKFAGDMSLYKHEHEAAEAKN